jgi:hypothetical protein
MKISAHAGENSLYTLTSVLLVRYVYAKSSARDILYNSEKRIFNHSHTFSTRDVKICQCLKK